MSPLVIEPAEGYVAIEFLEDAEQEEERAEYDAPNSDDYNQAVFAVCIGVGKKVTVCKRGDTVIVREYARQGVRIDENVVLVEAYCVLGIVSA